MQEDVELKLKDIIRQLNEINRIVNSKAIEKAIENIEIAIGELRSLKRKSSEGLDHYKAKIKLLEKILEDGGSCYLESEQTKLSKLGYRPDAVVIKDREVILVEIETDQSRMLRKLKKLRKVYPKILQSPILIGRSLRIVFGVTGNIKQKVIEEAKKLNNIEIYKINFNNNIILKIL
ncbi:MAG TPA: hypothetical protein EYG81_00205 [Archaeoglobus profundus]|nr:hypothetical protein [Archaeoglobus profundus]